MQNSKGYALVEVMIVLVIIGVLVAFMILALGPKGSTPAVPAEQTTFTQVKILENVKVNVGADNARRLVVICDKERGNVIYMTHYAMSVIKQVC